MGAMGTFFIHYLVRGDFVKRTVLVCGTLFLLIFSFAAYSKASSTITVRKIYNYKTSDITSIEFVDKKIYMSHKMPLLIRTGSPKLLTLT